MPGATIPLFSRRRFDFDNVQSSAFVEVSMIQAVDVRQYTEGTLLVRIHAHDIEPGAKIEVIARATAPTDEDPERDFVGVTVATVTIDATVAAPTLRKASFTSDPGERVTIAVRGSQPCGEPVSCDAELSAELVVKS